MEPRPAIVLIHPEIPHNTGAIGRTCVALDMELVLVHPLGFSLSDKHLKRSGLDYWQHVRVAEFADWAAFLADRQPREDQLFLFEEDGEASFYGAAYPPDAYLVFGSETRGIPADIRAGHADRQFHLPMHSAHIRSLNLANAATAAAYEALRPR